MTISEVLGPRLQTTFVTYAQACTFETWHRSFFSDNIQDSVNLNSMIIKMKLAKFKSASRQHVIDTH